MTGSRLAYLFSCYVQNDFKVQEEEEEFMTLLTQPGNKAEVQKLIDRLIQNNGTEIQMNDQVSASILNNILQKDKAPVILKPGKTKK